MKILKTLSTLFLCGVISTSFVACNSDDDDGDKPGNGGGGGGGATVMTKINETTDLDSFKVAVNQIGFNATLSSASNVTVFAPNNAVFVDLLDDLSASSIASLPNQTLKAILNYHVSTEGVYQSSDFKGTTYISSIDTTGPNGSNLSIQVININGDIQVNDDGMVVEKDIVGSNGVVHVIDGLLEKPNIYSFIKNDNRFDSLMILLSDGNFNYDDILSKGKRTVFAPTNAAFAAYISNDPSLDQMSDMQIFTIPSVVGYHLVSGSNVRKENMSQGQTLKTDQGYNLIVDLSSGVKLETINSAQAKVNVSETDLQTTSGVAHVVDEVLLY